MCAPRKTGNINFPLWLNGGLSQGCPDFQKVYVFKFYVPFSCPTIQKLKKAVEVSGEKIQEFPEGGADFPAGIFLSGKCPNLDFARPEHRWRIFQQRRNLPKTLPARNFGQLQPPRVFWSKCGFGGRCLWRIFPCFCVDGNKPQPLKSPKIRVTEEQVKHRFWRVHAK